jgi:hypothetical protein
VESEPYTEPQLKKICRAASQTGSIVLSKHAKERMAEQGLIMNDVINTLRGGKLRHTDFENGVYKYRLTTGKVDAVVIVTGPDSIFIVTAFRSAS